MSIFIGQIDVYRYYKIYKTVKIKLLPGILSTIMLIGCTLNSNKTITNRLEDKFEAEEIANEFFKYQDTNDTTVIGLFSDSFVKKNGKEQLIELLNKNKIRFGSLKKITLERWETKFVEGTNSSSEYFLVFNNEYENHHIKESFKMHKGNRGKIEVINYKAEIKD
jgi:hypothetical protein